MSLNIRHNMMAQMAQRNLGATYSKMSESINALSSGLRINSADDDAAGLAVRESMRANIASLDQGTRNANDAVSMLQTFDGAAQVIDEKLVRMKELAEQAATGTYNSDQLEIMNDEFQKMADEIDRIAESTDFNGIKGLNADGDITIHFGPGNDADEDKYDVSQQNMKASGSGQEVSGISDSGDSDEAGAGDVLSVADSSAFATGQRAVVSDSDGNEHTVYVQSTSDGQVTVDQDITGLSGISSGDSDITIEPAGSSSGVNDLSGIGSSNSGWVGVDDTSSFEVGDKVTMSYQDGSGTGDLEATDAVVSGIDEDSGEVYLEGVTPDFSTASASSTHITAQDGGTGTGLQLSGTDIKTQSNAQEALTKIDEAIQTKDKARAHFGAMMNRLKSTVRAENIQREKLQSAEAQISDVDVASEMAQLTRNRVLAQAGVSMLSQANSIPQMAQSLLRG